MRTQDFLKAIEIISQNHSSKIVINYCPPNGQVKIDNSIGILECCAAVTSKLNDEGYSLSMHNGFLNVDKY
jgi:hypothetical protein